MRSYIAIFVLAVTSFAAQAADYYMLNGKKIEISTVFTPSTNSVMIIVQPEYGLWIYPGSRDAIAIRDNCLGALDILISKFEGEDRRQTAECKIYLNADPIGFVKGTVSVRDPRNQKMLLEKYQADCLKAYSDPNYGLSSAKAAEICNGTSKP